MSDEYDKDLDPAFLEKLESIDDTEAEARARSLKAGLEDYDLETEDFDVLNGDIDSVLAEEELGQRLARRDPCEEEGGVEVPQLPTRPQGAVELRLRCHGQPVLPLL